MTEVTRHSTPKTYIILCINCTSIKKNKSQIPVSLNHSSGASHVQPGLRITRPQQQNFRNESKIVSCWVSLSSTCITRKLTGEQARFLWRSEPSATVSKGREHKPWKVCLVRSPDSLTQMPTKAEVIWGESTLRVENPRQGYPGTKVISAETKKGERSYLITSRIRYLWVIIGLYHSYETVTFLQAPYLSCSHI